MMHSAAAVNVLDNVEVENLEWRFYSSLASRTCSCGESDCYHLSVADDYFRDRLRKGKWTMMSAFHKEIRRSDFDRSLHFAKWLRLVRQKEKLIRYMVNMVFEETRNFHLFFELSTCDDLTRCVQLTAHSVKRWEGPNREKSFLEECDAVVEARDIPCPTEIGNPLRFDTRYEAMVHYWSIRLYDHDKSLKSAYCEKLREHSAHTLAHRLLDISEKKSDHLVMAILELEYDCLTPEDMAYKPQQRYRLDYGKRALLFESYVFDWHTWAGKSRIRSQWHNVRPNEPMPDKVDMRWSGSMLGSLWRHKAYAQFGEEYIAKNWEDVRISEQEWSKTKWYDAWWYKTLYFDMESKLV